MDRLEIAEKKYERIASGLFALDEGKSEEIEAWLRDFVVPVVADLQGIPAFRRYAKFGLSQLAAESDTLERLQVVALDDALVDCAAATVELGRQDEFKHLLADRDPLEELNEKKSGISSAPSLREGLLKRKHDPRSIVERMADRPWFSLVMDLDFPVLNKHLFVQVDSSSLDEAFGKFRPNIPVLGDGITRMMFARIGFWMHYLEAVWNRIHVRIAQTEDDLFAAHEEFFTTNFKLDECLEKLRNTCLSGDDVRMRDACCTLLQVYIAYHPRPQLSWLGVTEDRYQVTAEILRREFRRLSEVVECALVDSSTFREARRRPAMIVDLDSVQQVAAALADVAELYRQSVCPVELIEEARTLHRLVVVTKPRMAFFDGVKLDVDWNAMSKSWELLLHLAARAERLDGVDQYDLDGAPGAGVLSTRKYRLCKYLINSDDSTNSPAAQLASRIDKATATRRLYWRNVLD
jgi:hypothetical protein